MTASFTQNEINELASEVIEEFGEKVGYMYVGWYLSNCTRIVDEWFRGRKYTMREILNNSELAKHTANEFIKWYNSVEAEDF